MSPLCSLDSEDTRVDPELNALCLRDRWHAAPGGGENGCVIPRLQSDADSRLQIVGRRKPRGLNASLLCVFPIIVNEERLSATIEQLQRWIGQNLRGSGSRKFPISYPVFASSFALGRDQAPVSRQAWTKGAAGKRVVIEVPHGRLLQRGVVERIIGLAVAIKVRYAHDGPADRKSGAIQTGA